MSLAESLERAATELSDLADQIRPANGDPQRLLEALAQQDASRLLAWILNEDPVAADEVIQVWDESDQGAAILVALPDAGIAKPGRKLLRTARHRLRSRGIEAPPPSPASQSAPARAARPNNDRWQAARVSTPDSRGARVGYLVDSHPSGGARLFEIRFDAARGILDFKIYNAGRSKVREFLKSLTEGTDQRLFDVERDPLRSLVRRASLAQPIDRPLPTSFVEWRSRLFPEELDDQQTPGDLARVALGTDSDATPKSPGFEATFDAIREGRLGPWPPTTAWVREWMDSAKAATEGLEGQARAAAIESWLDAATEALKKETDPKLLTHYLNEMAWIRWQGDSEADARTLLTISQAMSESDEVVRCMSRARAEGLFAPFLAELRVVEQSAFDTDEAGD